MLILASAIALAVFTSFGFSNPNQAWAQALNDDDEETNAPSAAEPASEASPGYAPPAGGKRPTPETLPTAEERSMPARVPERLPTSTYEQVREPTPSPVGQLAARRSAGLVWMNIVAPRVGGNPHVDYSR